MIRVSRVWLQKSQPFIPTFLTIPTVNSGKNFCAAALLADETDKAVL